ncbi:PRTRC system protein B [Herbaspirillum sp. NPDC101396]|uniref:PRTRC system protein B n=1 Tax=Herbaspirillum sp. NPDC101396 TaxID=3364005 RepID=UPI00383A0C73
MSQVNVRTRTPIFEIHDDVTPQELNLEAAFLFYRSQDGRSVYASQHPIVFSPENPHAPVLGPGRAPSKKAIAALGASVAAATAFSGFVPAGMLYTGPNAMAWWCPPLLRHMWFKTSDAIIGEAHASISQPGLVFIAAHGDVHVFAVTGAERPVPDTKLFKAPYFNVWEGGKVCAGNVNFPKTTDASAIDAYERAFFGSRFTHPNDKKLVKWKGGSVHMWKHLLDNPNAEWDWAKRLVPCGATLAETIKGITK